VVHSQLLDLLVGERPFCRSVDYFGHMHFSKTGNALLEMPQGRLLEVSLLGGRHVKALAV
jgi:hypothetical protein